MSYNTNFTVKEYKSDIATKADEPYFYDLRGVLHVSREAAQATPKTHEIVYYGGSRENVVILRNYTRKMATCLYGTMQVISDTPDMLGNYTRWVHFGLYNAIGVNPLFPHKPNGSDDSDKPGIYGDEEEWYVRGLVGANPDILRANYRYAVKSDDTNLMRIIEAIAIERRIDLETGEVFIRDC